MLGSFRCRLRAVLETKIWKTWNTTDYSWRNKNCSINHYFIVRIRLYGRCSRKLEGRYMSIKVFHCWMNNFCISTQKLERVVRVVSGKVSKRDFSRAGFGWRHKLTGVARKSENFWCFKSNRLVSQFSKISKYLKILEIINHYWSKTKLVTLPRTKNFPTRPRRNNYWVPNSPLAWLHCR